MELYIIYFNPTTYNWKGPTLYYWFTAVSRSSALKLNHLVLAVLPFTCDNLWTPKRHGKMKGFRLLKKCGLQAVQKKMKEQSEKVSRFVKLKKMVSQPIHVNYYN